MLALRVIVYASASVCCNIELHISRLRMRLPLYVASLRFITRGFCVRAFCFFVCDCMLILRVIVYAFAFCMLEGCVSSYTCV